MTELLADPPQPAPAAPGGLSIRWKLFLLIGGLVTAVTVAFGGAAYKAMDDSARSDASVRLDGIAAQWARLFEGSAVRQFAAIRAVAASPAIAEALARRDPAALAAAESALRGLIGPDQVSTVRLLGPRTDVERIDSAHGIDHRIFEGLVRARNGPVLIEEQLVLVEEPPARG